MYNLFSNLDHTIQAFIAALFTWSITSIGAALVFFFKKINKTVMDSMLSFAAGVMISASFFSLLNPSLEMAKKLGMTPYIVSTIGFILGGILLFLGDKLFKDRKKDKKRSIMLITSITLHNIPEGLAIGVAFGSLKYGLDGVTLSATILLALGIGIQNLPEGTAISVPLRREGYSRKKAFLIGVLSGIVEPISAVIGSILVLKVRYLLPLFLAFAAGAMIYVVTEELIPESQTNKKKDLMAFITIIGFSLMMILDVALG